MTLLGDLSAPVVKVDIKTPYGKEVQVALAIPSYHRYREIMASVPEPLAPLKVTEDRKSKVPDRQNAEYVRALQERSTEQNYRVLVAALIGGGMEIPGATLADQTAAFRASDPDAGIVGGLVTFLAQAVEGVRAQPETSAFQPVPQVGDASLSGDGDDAANVADTP